MKTVALMSAGAMAFLVCGFLVAMTLLVVIALVWETWALFTRPRVEDPTRPEFTVTYDDGKSDAFTEEPWQ